MFKKLYATVVLIAVLAVVVIAYFYYVTNMRIRTDTVTDNVEGNVQTLIQARLIAGLKGSLVLELANVAGVTKEQLTYTLNMANAPNSLLQQASDFIQPHDSHFSITADQAVFTTLTRRRAGQVASDIYSAMQVFVAPVNRGTGKFPMPASKPYQITNSDGVLKQMPTLSPDGTHVLYMAQTKIPKSALVAVKDWHIYLTDTTTKITDNEGTLAQQSQQATAVVAVANGTYPRWVDDSSFIYIAEQGLMLHRLDGNSDTLLWGLAGTKALSNMRLDISDNKKFIAWSFPDIGKLWVLKVANWANPEIMLYDDVATHGFWPTFSPDSKYLAFQAVNWSQLKTDPQPRIEVYALQEGGMSKIDWQFSLSSFDQERMFITDWY